MLTQEQIIRKVTEVGNGAHIFAPKEWLNENVLIIRIQKKDIKQEILEILSPYLEKIISVFLYGSYAREENTENSDIDVFVISKEKFKIEKNGKFEINVIQESSLDSALKINPILFFSALKEGKPIINGNYFEEIKKKKIEKKLFLPFVKSTKESLISTEEIFELDKKTGNIASNSAIYSLILRLRGIFITNLLLKNSPYSNSLFKKWIIENCDINFERVYSIYQAVRSDQNAKPVKIEEEEKLIIFLKNEIAKLESKLK